MDKIMQIEKYPVYHSLKEAFIVPGRRPSRVKMKADLQKPITVHCTGRSQEKS